jgi:hypothetical protein
MHKLAALLPNVEKLFTLLQAIDSAVHVQDAQGVEGQEPGGLQAGSTTLIFSFSFYPFQIPFEVLRIFQRRWTIIFLRHCDFMLLFPSKDRLLLKFNLRARNISCIKYSPYSIGNKYTHANKHI